MAILNVLTSQTGLIGVTPSPVYINTNDTIATVTTAGYLNKAVAEGFSFSNFNIALVYTTDGLCGWYQISISGTNTSLISTVSPGAVQLPVIAGHLATFVTTAGEIGDTATTAIHGASIQAGLSGTAGTLISFPAVATSGALTLAAVTNASGNFNTTISNAAAIAQSQVISIPDSGAATANFVVASTGTLARFKSIAGAAAAGGAATQSFTDAFCTSSSCIVGNWNTQANAASVLKIVPGNGSFVVTSTADAGVGTFNYIITK